MGAAAGVGLVRLRGRPQPHGSGPNRHPPPILPAADFPAGTVLHVVSGEDQSPVRSASVIIGAQELTTDDAGALRLPTDFDAGTLVDIIEPNFLLRQTRLREITDPRYSLWPKESPTGMTEAFVVDVVYHDSKDVRSAETLVPHRLSVVSCYH